VAVDYSRHAADYDRVRADEAMDREFWLHGLVEVGRLRDGERVLDLGAGTGRFAQLLSTTNRVVAFDSSDAMLRIARAKGPFECVEGDGHRLPFRANTFDLAMVVMVLHHLGDYIAALRDVARVARRVVVATSDMATRRLGILEEAFPSLLAIRRSSTRLRRRAFEPPSSTTARTFEGLRRPSNSTAYDIGTSRPSTSCLRVSMSEGSVSWRPRCPGATETASRYRLASRS